MSSEQLPGRKLPLGADLVIPALALGFAAYFFFSIADLAWEAKANGVLIGSVLVLLAAIQLVRVGVRLAKGEGDLSLDPLLLPRDALPKRVGMVVLTALFIGTMKWLGLTLALLLAMLAGLYLMGVRKRSQLIYVSLGVATAGYLMFIAVLESDFPRGPIEQLLAMRF
jgi:hypothetical protein